jgi:hypothetical protein
LGLVGRFFPDSDELSSRAHAAPVSSSVIEAEHEMHDAGDTIG